MSKPTNTDPSAGAFTRSETPMSDDKTITVEGTVKVLWCLDHDDYAIVGEHDDCETEWRETGGSDEHDGECDCVGCEKTRMGWIGGSDER